jgi:predicted ArsR family transcriptional regulator
VRPLPGAPPAEKILHHLKTKGPATAQALARRLGVTAMAVRQQLDRLEAEGLVAFEERAGRVGRPPRVWRLTPAAQARFPDAHAELAVGVIASARAAFGEAGLREIVRRRTAQQAAAYAREMPPPRAPLEQRVAALARIRDGEGYMATSSRAEDGAFLLAENHCPICAAAAACVGLCDGELDLFRTVLGPGVEVVREEHQLEGARRCLYRVRGVSEGSRR